MTAVEMNWMRDFAISVIAYGSIFVISLFVLACLAIVYIYLVDRHQTEQTVRRNYPVIGRFRYMFEHLGEFFRQYFFALDREELPFNRAVRSWVYRAAKNIDDTIAFGSTRPLNQPGDIIFLNALFPILDTKEHNIENTVVLGEGFCTHPYATSSVFNISGMSYGALSAPAVKSLSHGASKAGVWMNTGEGGLSPHHLSGDCDIVFQIGTAKYGVRNSEGKLCDIKLKEHAARPQVKMFEIKLSQGAKPGKGGILPGGKVSADIAQTRGIPEGVASISPNCHEDIHSIDDLLDLIKHVRDTTGKPCGIKAVIGSHQWLEEISLRIHERGLDYAPDFMTIDSADGGTGASPQALMDFVGLPLRQSLPLVVDTLVKQELKDRIKIVASGKLVTPAYVAWALAAGADFVSSARGYMFALGCIQALQCNKNTCPTGITTHNKKLQYGLNPEDKAVRVMQYAKNMHKEISVLSHACGVAEPRQLRRKHARIVLENGKSMSMAEIYPDTVGQSHVVHINTPKNSCLMHVEKVG